MEEEKHFKNYIQKSISIGFIIIIGLASFISYFIIKKTAYPILLKKEQKEIETTGNSIVFELRDKIKNAETLSLSMSNIFKVLDKKNSVFMKVIPSMLNLSGYKNIIAGGGVWPEPYTFTPYKYYRSFFWGRDKTGYLKFYNDYNNPSGDGYFHKEWYVPARYVKRNRVYWSRSYIDPYSKEPMVTCTSPIWDKKRFLGVTTVDLKLEGLSKLFSTYARKIQGYIFILDRDNNFLYFPNERIIKDKSSEKKYINLFDFVKKYPAFEPVLHTINTIDKNLVKLAEKNNSFKRITEKLLKESSQINRNEAIFISTILIDPLTGLIQKKHTTKLSITKIFQDIILQNRATCTIFYMPKTYWKIGVVVPDKLINGLVNKISREIISLLVLSLLFILTIAYLIINKYLLVPLKKITNQLVHSDERDIALGFNARNELGRMVYYLNKRTIQLKESEEYAKAIFEQSPISIQIFDKNGIAIDANIAWEKLWKVNKEDFNGRYNIFKDKILKNSREFQYIKDAFKGKSNIIKNFEYKLRTVANIGRDRILNVIIFPIKDNRGSVARVVVMQEDVTDKVRMEETLRRVGQLEALGELAAGVAHDFNNILTGIILNLEMLEMQFSNDKKALKFLKKIGDSIESAKGLVDKIRMVSRKEKFEMVPLKLDKVLQIAVDLVKPGIPLNIKINIKIFGKDFWLHGDRNSLIQLIMNIIINAKDAIKFSDRKDGVIGISLEEGKDNLILKISDNGIGIPENIKDKIFEPFYTTKQKTSERGTGLGLSIAYNIVELHHGEIELNSVVGVGTIFTIKFPKPDNLLERDEQLDNSEQLDEKVKDKTVLLIEDEDNIRDAEADILSILGLQVIKAENGKIAVEILENSIEEIDIVFVDWEMPIMNGEHTINAIRKLNENIPIFIISGSIDVKITEFKESGIVTDIINKPFSKNEVINKLNRLFSL